MFPCTSSDNGQLSADIKFESRFGRRTNNIFGGIDKEVPGEKWKITLYYVKHTIHKNAVKTVYQLQMEH